MGRGRQASSLLFGPRRRRSSPPYYKRFKQASDQLALGHPAAAINLLAYLNKQFDQDDQAKQMIALLAQQLPNLNRADWQQLVLSLDRAYQQKDPGDLLAELAYPFFYTLSSRLVASGGDIDQLLAVERSFLFTKANDFNLQIVNNWAHNFPDQGVIIGIDSGFDPDIALAARRGLYQRVLNDGASLDNNLVNDLTAPLLADVVREDLSNGNGEMLVHALISSCETSGGYYIFGQKPEEEEDLILRDLVDSCSRQDQDKCAIALSLYFKDRSDGYSETVSDLSDRFNLSAEGRAELDDYMQRWSEQGPGEMVEKTLRGRRSDQVFEVRSAVAAMIASDIELDKLDFASPEWSQFKKEYLPRRFWSGREKIDKRALTTALIFSIDEEDGDCFKLRFSESHFIDRLKVYL